MSDETGLPLGEQFVEGEWRWATGLSAMPRDSWHLSSNGIRSLCGAQVLSKGQRVIGAFIPARRCIACATQARSVLGL